MNPFRFRSEMNAQDFIDCEYHDCFSILRKEREEIDDLSVNSY